MRSLIGMFLQISLLAFLYTQIIHCDLGDSPKGPSRWFVEWTFIDTSNSIDPVFYMIEVRSDNISIDLNGYVYSNGAVFEYFDTEHESLLLTQNPTFRIQIFEIDSAIVYDSIFSWEQMDFKEQNSVINDQVLDDLSKKMIYLDSITSDFSFLKE